MQAYAEGFEIMGTADEFDLDLHEIASIWRYGSVVRSWLLDLAERALRPDAGFDDIKGVVVDSGEGRWTAAGGDRPRRAGTGDRHVALHPLRLPGAGLVPAEDALRAAQPVRRPRRDARIGPAGPRDRQTPTPVTQPRPAPMLPVADVPAAFTGAVRDAFAARPGPRFALVLSGGPTAQACYEHLAADDPAAAGAIDWSVVDVYMGDERVVPPDDLDANQRLVKETLIDRVGRVGSFTPMPTVGPVAECVAGLPDAIMSDLVTGPGIDLIHLGMGPDGHTASLFPGAPTLEAEPGVLVAGHRGPQRRATPTRASPSPCRPSIRPGCAVFTVAGDSKADAVAQLRRGATTCRPPASMPDRTIWLVDGAAFGDAP